MPVASDALPEASDALPVSSDAPPELFSKVPVQKLENVS
jgi:hypothetical protein